MKKTLTILIILVLAVGLFAQGSKDKSNTLTVYNGLLEEHGAAVCQAFEKATGIKTEYVRMSGGEIYARIRAERENPQASVWYGGGSLTFIEAKNDGLLENYISPNAEIGRAHV